MKNVFSGLLMSFGMFSIFPLPNNLWNDQGARHILKFYPLVGFLIGLFIYYLYNIFFFINLPIMLFAFFVLFFIYFFTGMLHLDGYMDVCDSLLSRRSREEKIRILKDSHVGAFSVIYLIFLLLLNFCSIYTFINNRKSPYFLLFILMISRAINAIFMLYKKPIEKSYFINYFQKYIKKIDKIISFLIFIIICFIFIYIFKEKAFYILFLMILSNSICMIRCEKQLSGISGDVAGFSLVISESIGILTSSLL